MKEIIRDPKDLIKIINEEVKSFGLTPRENFYIDGTQIKFIVQFHEIFNMTCPKCGNTLQFKLNPDPDSLFFHDKCCGKHYQLWANDFTLEVLED